MKFQIKLASQKRLTENWMPWLRLILRLEVAGIHLSKLQPRLLKKPKFLGLKRRFYYQGKIQAKR